MSDSVTRGRQTLVRGDCVEWLEAAEATSIAAVVTDPPYGFREYEADDHAKLRSGAGGAWRVPPSFDGAQRRPLPRFADLTERDRNRLVAFYGRWGTALLRVLKPGAHIFVASTPTLEPLVAQALGCAGVERRGQLIRLVRTFRGGDRPKGAEAEFPMVSTTPRSCFEPWGIYRRPLSESTEEANFKRWGVGMLLPSDDVIDSEVTSKAERAIANHPSIKPQRLLRHLVRIALPDTSGVVLDPFAGSGSTLAACEAVNVQGIGVERDQEYFEMAADAIPALARVGTDVQTAFDLS